MDTMVAARLHRIGEPMVLERLPVPKPRPSDVLVQVKACGIVPNLGNVLTHWQTWFPELPLPKLPAIFGLDVAGVVAEAGGRGGGGAPPGRGHRNSGFAPGPRSPRPAAHTPPPPPTNRKRRFWPRARHRSGYGGP